MYLYIKKIGGGRNIYFSGVFRRPPRPRFPVGRSRPAPVLYHGVHFHRSSRSPSAALADVNSEVLAQTLRQIFRLNIENINCRLCKK